MTGMSRVFHCVQSGASGTQSTQPSRESLPRRQWLEYSQNILGHIKVGHKIINPCQACYRGHDRIYCKTWIIRVRFLSFLLSWVTPSNRTPQRWKNLLCACFKLEMEASFGIDFDGLSAKEIYCQFVLRNLSTCPLRVLLGCQLAAFYQYRLVGVGPKSRLNSQVDLDEVLPIQMPGSE